jgi:hypothetical protein
MDDSLRIVCEMYQMLWDRFKNALEELREEEIHWRPAPAANTINLIVRHLCIEAEWHLDSLAHGAPMPTITAPVSQEMLDAVPLDFAENFKILEECYTRFVEILRSATLKLLQERTSAAYGEASEREGRTYLLAYHQALHLSLHCGQIRTLRNLYCKMHGEPQRFFAENPTYPS